MMKRLEMFFADHRQGNRYENHKIVDFISELAFKNINFGKSLRDEPEFRKQLSEKYSFALSEQEWNDLVRAVTVNVIAREYGFGKGQYPSNMFIRRDEEMDLVVRAMFRTKAASRLDARRVKFFCIGSCFATNVAFYMKNLGLTTHTAVIAENINSPRNNKDLFDFFQTGRRAGLLSSDRVVQNHDVDRIRQDFLNSDVLILTLGCAFTLVDAQTGQPVDRLTPTTVFHNPTVSEIKTNLHSIFKVARAHAYKRIFVTVSPVPLSGTLLHDQNPFVSDSVSKSKLRAAIEEICQADEDIIYFPSFEVFRQFALHSFFPLFGLEDGDTRHPNAGIVEKIVRTFIEQNFDVETASTDADPVMAPTP